MDWTLLGAVGATGSGFVLLGAGGWKLRHRRAFALTLQEHGRVVAANAARLAWAVSAAELVVGLGVLALVLPPSARADAPLPPAWPALLGMAVLGGLFAGYAGVQLARGLRPPCGCLGGRDRLGPHTVARALAIGAGGLGGWLAETAGQATDPLPTPLWGATVGAGGLLVAVVLVVGLPLVAGPGRSADGDRDGPGRHQLTDNRRPWHLAGDEQPP